MRPSGPVMVVSIVVPESVPRRTTYPTSAGAVTGATPRVAFMQGPHFLGGHCRQAGTMDNRGRVAHQILGGLPQLLLRPIGSRRIAARRVGGPCAIERIDHLAIPLDREVQMWKLRSARASYPPQHVPCRDRYTLAYRDASALQMTVLGRPAASMIEANAVAAFSGRPAWVLAPHRAVVHPVAHSQHDTVSRGDDG